MKDEPEMIEGEEVPTPIKEYLFIGMYKIKDAWYLMNRPYYYAEALFVDMRLLNAQKYKIVRIRKPADII